MATKVNCILNLLGYGKTKAEIDQMLITDMGGDVVEVATAMRRALNLFKKTTRETVRLTA